MPPPVASDGTIIGVYAGDNSFLPNSPLAQHARYRLRGIPLAKHIEKATRC
jgi:hypothetical protein